MSSIDLQDLPSGTFLPFHVPVTVAPNVAAPLAGAIRLGGWSFLETTGAATALIELWDGGPTGGESIALIALTAGGAFTKAAPGLGLVIRSGLSIVVLAGSVRGSIWGALANVPVHLPTE